MKREITFRQKKEEEWIVKEVIREKHISLKEIGNRVIEFFKFMITRLTNLFIHA